LIDLKNTKFGEVKTKIHEASMIYKGIERLYGDLNPLMKKVEDYRSAISPFLSLKKAASMCHHPNDVGKEKAMCSEQVKLEQSQLAMVHANLDALNEKHEGAA